MEVFSMTNAVISSWLTPSTASETWEKGPCPASWRSPAILTRSLSSLLSSNWSASFDARCMVPIECSNREWFAPG